MIFFQLWIYDIKIYTLQIQKLLFSFFINSISYIDAWRADIGITVIYLQCIYATLPYKPVNNVLHCGNLTFVLRNFLTKNYGNL